MKLKVMVKRNISVMGLAVKVLFNQIMLLPEIFMARTG
jgi:hypothetical protein